MNELKSRFLLNASGIFSIDRQINLVDKYKNVSQLFENQDILNEICSNEEKEKFLKICDRIEQNNDYERLKSKGVNFILKESDEYPISLNHVKSPPHILYTIGDITNLNHTRVAIIGTRRANLYGRQQSQLFATNLASAGIQIISGLAKGIDSIAMKNALEIGGKAIGILGTGIDVVYPKENRELFKLTAEKGLIITEFPPGSKPLAHHFPWRNRLISGLSQAILVVQASIKSGTNGTVKWALEQGKDIFAIPGPINCEYSKGPNSMIKDGAHCALSPDDIIEFFNSHSQQTETGTNVEINPTPINPNTNQTENLVPEKLKELGLDFKPKDVEIIMEETGLDYALLTRKLNLEIAKGNVEKIPGGRYKVKS
jgi:DNA processing protein